MRNIWWQVCAMFVVGVKSIIVVKLLAGIGSDALIIASQFMVTSAFLAQISFFNYEAAYVKNVASNKADSEEYLYMNFNLTIFFAVVLAGIFLLKDLASNLIWGCAADYKIYLMCVYAILQAKNLLNFFTYQAKKSHQRSAILQMLQAIGSIFSVLVIKLTQRIEYGLFFLVLFEGLTYYVFRVRGEKLPRETTLVGYRSWVVINWRISISALIGAIGIWVMFNIGRFMAVDLGHEVSSKYIVNLTIVSVLSYVVQPIAVVMYPELCSTRQNAVVVIKKWLRIILLVLFSVSVLLALVSKMAIELLSNASYFVSYLFVMILLLGQFSYSIVRLVSLYFVATNHPGVPLVGFLIGGAVVASLIYPLSAVFGLNGLAYSFALGNVVAFVILMYSFFIEKSRNDSSIFC